MTGEGAVVSKHGRDGDDRDAAGVGCHRNSSSAGTRVGTLMPTSGAGVRRPDPDLGHGDDPSGDRRGRPGQPQRDPERRLGRLLSKIESPTKPTMQANTRRHRSRKTRSIN